MQTELARINRREEIAPDDRQDRERAPDQNKKQDENAQPVLQRPSQGINVTLTKFLKSSVK